MEIVSGKKKTPAYIKVRFPFVSTVFINPDKFMHKENWVIDKNVKKAARVTHYMLSQLMARKTLKIKLKLKKENVSSF